MVLLKNEQKNAQKSYKSNYFSILLDVYFLFHQ